MASLTLKNLPDHFLQALRAAADRDRRSLTQEIIHLVEVALRASPRKPVPEAEAQVAAWKELAGQWRSDVDAETEAKRVVARRSRGREVAL